MARQASNGEPRKGAEGWRAMLGAYVANEGCEYQAIAFGILAQCGAPPHPAERTASAPRIAERDPR